MVKLICPEHIASIKREELVVSLAMMANAEMFIGEMEIVKAALHGRRVLN
jgi:hypothetical protein